MEESEKEIAVRGKKEVSNSPGNDGFSSGGVQARTFMQCCWGRAKPGRYGEVVERWLGVGDRGALWFLTPFKISYHHLLPLPWIFLAC